MNRFVETFRPSAETTVLDVGGTPYNWEQIGARFPITLLNSEPLAADGLGAHYTLVQGSGTRLDFPDRSFDIAFSNSVLEHVGSLDAQRAFAKELRRVGRQLWVYCVPPELTEILPAPSRNYRAGGAPAPGARAGSKQTERETAADRGEESQWLQQFLKVSM